MFKKSVPTLDFKDLPAVPLVLEGVSSRFIRENRIIPLSLKNNVLEVVMADPGDASAVDALRVATASEVVVFGADGKAIDEYISRFYWQEPNNLNRIIEEIGDKSVDLGAAEDGQDIGHLKDLASEAPVIKLVNMFILRAVENRASDIHIEPFEGELKVRYRIDGMLHDIEALPKGLQPAVVSRIKLIARLNIAERRLPQDGRIGIRVNDREIDLRVSTIPVLYGESIVIRILHKEGILMDLDRLGLKPALLAEFNSLIGRPNGIVLVTGPTGSGKTTTLYSALNRINSPEKKIITVEDPVEYKLEGVNQIQVKPQIGLNFANTIRHIVRQDPDIIMIGEIRDLETAEIAVQSALTGHLVFSTLHTNDAPSSITRLLDMKVKNYLLSSTLRGVLAQRLVRVVCPACKKENAPEADAGGLRALGLYEPVKTYKGGGCEECSYTGYRGRIGLFELFVVGEEIQKMIMRNADANQLRDAAKKHGMRTLVEDGIEKVREGATTVDEVMRVTQEG